MSSPRVLGSFSEHDPYDTRAAAEFYATEPRPDDLAHVEEQLASFVQQHGARKIVLVTSGGTTVPLEVNTVRFIDNFSAGTRGAISTECFLAMGYAVIFLHRKFSLAPYTRSFLPTVNNFLDHLVLEPSGVLRGMSALVLSSVFRFVSAWRWRHSVCGCICGPYSLR